MSRANKINFQENPAVTRERKLRDITGQVGKMLVRKGYETGNQNGYAGDSYRQLDVIGILKPIGKYPFKILGRKLKHVGNLWFDSKTKGANVDKTWVLEIYGREYVTELGKVMEELSEKYNDIKVQMILEREDPETRYNGLLPSLLLLS